MLATVVYEVFFKQKLVNRSRYVDPRDPLFVVKMAKKPAGKKLNFYHRRTTT